MKCPECGENVQPVNHNNRGWRCPDCWTLFPNDMVVEPEAKPEIVEEISEVVEEAPKPRPRKADK